MSLWDGQQREWLQAMGYSLLSLAGDDAPAGVEPGLPTAPAQTSSSPMPRRDEPGDAPVRGAEPPVADAPRARPEHAHRPAPPKPAEDVPAAPPRVAPRTDAAGKAAALDAARRAGATRQFEGPLWDALVTATRQSPALAARTLRELGADPAALRDDPAAKRRLWTRLRGLRARGQQ